MCFVPKLNSSTSFLPIQFQATVRDVYQWIVFLPSDLQRDQPLLFLEDTKRNTNE